MKNFKIIWKSKKRFNPIRTTFVKTNSVANARSVLMREEGKNIEIISCEEIKEETSAEE